MLTFCVSKSPLFGALAGAAVLISSAALASPAGEDQSLVDCVEAARALGNLVAPVGMDFTGKIDGQ